ncbi:MAG TPA: SUF system NifU family Fe-S cluster assembly protein [Aliidongia sp.]|nr:SUF system NifU family Fe-S cluster assembly protein [Aliidongia sp.]
MMDLRDLYQDIILDHGHKPRNFRPQEHASHTAQGHNPLCGDRVTIYLTVESDRIADVSFVGRGCAISTASSSLMTEVLKGKTLEEADILFKAFHATVTGAGEIPPVTEALEDDFDRLAPLEGVKTYPARVKCATLAWHAFEAALKSGGKAVEPVKTE